MVRRTILEKARVASEVTLATRAFLLTSQIQANKKKNHVSYFARFKLQCYMLTRRMASAAGRIRRSLPYKVWHGEEPSIIIGVISIPEYKRCKENEVQS